ncbi:MAG: M48 family metallopeptidase [Fusobacteriaceae bacterium]|nr:M48 family metallopeptidase [Fusobacteriaceae bacterium]MBP9509604.1 M48 family metallopeptidase [Fusobacteriaceae bacterium]
MFEYTIKRKNIKNIILKINRKGDIIVSAPLKISKASLDKFIISNTQWIKEKLTKITLNPPHFSPVNSEFIYLFGEKIDLPENFPNNLEEKKIFLSNYYKNKSIELVTPIIEHFLKITGLTMEHLTFRVMRTRWGSCNSSKKYININSILVASPLESIEYIALHEIAHLHFPHHKKEFWNFISKYMPDWEIRKKQLIFFEL